MPAGLAAGRWRFCGGSPLGGTLTSPDGEEHDQRSATTTTPKRAKPGRESACEKRRDDGGDCHCERHYRDDRQPHPERSRPDAAGGRPRYREAGRREGEQHHHAHPCPAGAEAAIRREMNISLYHLTGISRGRATVTYAGQPIGAIYQRPGTDLWRAEMIFAPGRGYRLPGLHAGRRRAQVAVIERHMAAQERQRARAR